LQHSDDIRSVWKFRDWVVRGDHDWRAFRQLEVEHRRVGRALNHRNEPLQRARDTAAAIALPHGLEVETDPAFKELGFGEWEGLTLDEARARDGVLYDGWAKTPHLVSPPGAETLDQVRERVLGGLQRLRAGHQNEVVCLVAHGIPVRILILEALGLGLDRIWSLHSAPTGISELEFRDDWTALHRMNTLVHLDTVLAGR